MYFQCIVVELFLAFVFALFFYGIRDEVKGIGTFFDSIYFSFVTITTLGYGDIVPLTELAKFMVMMESVAGIVLLGFFLIVVSSEVADRKERDRIETQKLSFIEQYKIWRENTIDSLISLSESTLLSKDKQELNDKEKFRDYFKENNSKHWYEVANNLSYDNFYTKEILHELEFLQRNIETFIMQVPIEDINSLNRLNRYINGLYKMRKYDLNDSDERKIFMRTLWELITLWDLSTGSYDKDYLLDTVDSL